MVFLYPYLSLSPIAAICQTESYAPYTACASCLLLLVTIKSLLMPLCPAFWYTPPATTARCFLPLAWLYAQGTALYQAKQTKRAFTPEIPVICIGNLSVGGTGKTPMVLALTHRLRAQGHNVHILARGYRGRARGVVRVAPHMHTHRDVGDEALLLARAAPTWVSADRAAAAQAAQNAGASVLVLDDGLQNHTLVKHLSIITIDAERGFGNGYVLPAGPLREPIDTGLTKAHCCVIIGQEQARTAFCKTYSKRIAIPIVHAHIDAVDTSVAIGKQQHTWNGLRVYGFAGIGNPNKFFATLNTLGADIVGVHALPDHAPISLRLLQRLQHRAQTLNAHLVTTEKDAVRLPHTETPVLVVKIALHIQNWQAIDHAVHNGALVL